MTEILKVPLKKIIFINNCTTCGKEFEIWNNGLKCRPCVNKKHLETKLKTHQKLIEKNVFKTCRICNQNKSISLFRPARNSCNDCERIRCRDYRRKNPKIARTWNENNKLKHAELQAQWYQRNKDLRNKKERERSKNDLVFRLRRNCRSRISSILKKNGKKICEFLHCSNSFFKEWVEFCIKKLNYNEDTKYEIDHVLPIDCFNIENNEELFICLHWINLMPLLPTINHKKNNKIWPKQVEKQKGLLLEFTKQKGIIIDNEIKLWETYFTKFLQTKPIWSQTGDC